MLFAAWTFSTGYTGGGSDGGGGDGGDGGGDDGENAMIDDGEGGLGAYHIGMPVTHCDIVCFV